MLRHSFRWFEFSRRRNHECDWKWSFREALPLAVLLAASLSNAALALDIQLPPETTAFKQDLGAEIANAQCLICHSVEYVAMQPPMPLTFWKSSIQKMQQKYGAIIPDEQVEPLVGYLVKTYGTEKSDREEPAATLTRKADSVVPSSTESTDLTATAAGGKLAARFGCAGCHSVDKKIVGPAFKDIALKYRGHADAFEKVSWGWLRASISLGKETPAASTSPQAGR